MTDIKITTERLRQLEEAEAKLEALEAAGVDNWDGYDDALEPIRQKNARRETADAILSEIMDILADGIEEPAGHGCGYGVRDGAAERIIQLLLTDKRIDLKVMP
jgi:hypothetical protein